MKIYPFILSLIILLTQNLKSQIILDSNYRGFERIELRKTTQNQLVTKFGNNFKEKEEFRKVHALILMRGKDCQYKARFKIPTYKVLAYKKIGIQFKLNPKSK